MKGYLTSQYVIGILLIYDTEAYKALFIGAVGSPSHKNFYMGIINELADHGNEVTLVTPYPSKRLIPNVREIEVKEGDLSQFNINHFQEKGVPHLSTMTQFFSLCVDTMENEQVQQLIQEKFDVILLSMFFSECYVSFIHQLKIPYIMVYPGGLMSNHAEYIGNPTYPSYLSLPIFEGKHPLTFRQRTVNVLTELILPTLINKVVYGFLESGCRTRGLCLETMPSYSEILYNSSLIFVNGVRELEIPSRPYVPGVIHVGGIHCRAAKPLPQDLEEWIQGAGEHGFIFFSLGSAVKPSDLPEKHRQVLLNVFGSLKQRVLWKWDKDTMPNMPTNVRLGKWLPQQDILGHSKLKVFITHGGLLSTFESIYHGIPILGMPVFADQQSNMQDVQNQGWGKVIMWDDLNEDNLLQTINTIITDKKMHEIAQFRSRLMRDQPTTPSSRANYWTDYVIRYNGATHLRSPIADMCWFTFYNVDVYLMLTTVCALSLWISMKIFCVFVNCCLGRRKKKQD